MVEAAKREIEEIPAAEAVRLAGRDDVVLVDIRDIRELGRDGKVPGAFHAPRGMLEFWIDPLSPYFKPVFGEDKKFVFFCAGGLRSALAAKTAQDMGLKPVAHILGGFRGWKDAGGPVEAGEAKKSQVERQRRPNKRRFVRARPRLRGFTISRKHVGSPLDPTYEIRAQVRLGASRATAAASSHRSQRIIMPKIK